MPGRLGWLAAACVAGALSGCDGEEPLLLNSMGLRPIPVDTTRPDELPEGEYIAFGLRFPRGLRMASQSPQSLEAIGRDIKLEHAVNYFRDRVEGGKINPGPSSTRFRRVTPIGANEPRFLDIDVIQGWRSVRVVVTDNTPKKRAPEPNLTEKERWGRMGLTPDGKVLEEYAQ